ncbi:succinate dehydrogenase cytochrome b560 subunit, mitochondrial-like [Branchiostoma lanceolatum]|uniref:succinate dehydrogenase cytochrome b560 subunit, mitochondrial-like n=1 Tax=Branchiostoma lanceolatum TaxID=7740 RepID=UPI003451E92F
MALSMLLVRNSAAISRLGMLSAPLRSAALSSRLVAPMTTTAQEEMAKFWDKNAQRKRPMSPHLTIYKPQLTAMLSITHRGTGAAMAGFVYAFSMGMLVVNPLLGWDFPTIISFIKSLEIHPWLILGGKWFMAWPIAYHAMNGVRHLSWDAGYGFNMKVLYRSGWFVFLSSFLLADLMLYFL